MNRFALLVLATLPLASCAPAAPAPAAPAPSVYLDNTGRDDVLVGAQCNNEGTHPPARICAGAAYLIYGGGL